MAERNYASMIASLRRKAKDPAVTEHERDALNAKADELAAKYNVVESERQGENGQVPTFDEFFHDMYQRKAYYYYHFFDDRLTFTTPPRSARYDPFKDDPPWTVINEWVVTLDEDPKDNGNYEFPQEEGQDDGDSTTSL